MVLRLLNLKNSRHQELKPGYDSAPDIIYSVYYDDYKNGGTIQLIYDALPQNTSQKAFKIPFIKGTLPRENWELLQRIIERNSCPQLLNESEAGEFRILFTKFMEALKTDYAFKDEYLIIFLKIIIFLMDKISLRTGNP